MNGDLKNKLLIGKRVVLKPLKQDDIEQIRIWRNSRDVNQYFIYRKHITKEQQIKWFDKISKSNNDFFFTIKADGELIGLTEIKNIDWNEGCGESGMFLVHKRNSLFSYEAAILLFDFAFYHLQLKKIVAKVLENNYRAFRFNKGLGFKEVEREQIEIDNQLVNLIHIELTYLDYQKRAIEIKKILENY